MSREYMEADHPSTWLRRHLLVGPSKIAEVVKVTIGQRVNPLWAAVRKWRFTASNFGVILHAAEKNRYHMCLIIIKSMFYLLSLIFITLLGMGI
jgi:hypothetical protein